MQTPLASLEAFCQIPSSPFADISQNPLERRLTSSDLRDQLQATLSGRYTLERELGGGGMSRVFVAEEAALGRKVVIKVLPPETAAQVSLERFKREILLAAKLQHPHIVPLLTAGESNGLPYFTMPFVDGESLRVRLARHGELPVNTAIRILREVASALAYAHEHGIVHRDLKPDNVLLSGGSAMVTDFGVAKALTASTNAEHAGITSVGVALGTPAYMSPEQASGDPSVDHRADIYSFGVFAYELLTGQPPFAGRTPQNLLAAHVAEAPEAINKRRASLPPALAALVMRCLEKRPADRPQSADEVVHALDEIATPSGGMIPTGTQTAPVMAPSSRGARRWAALATAAVVLIVIASWLLATRTGGAARLRSIAVLPTDIGADTAHAFLADGLSSDLTTKLSKIPGLSVRAYTPLSVMHGRTVGEAGKELGVGAIVMVRMARSGTRFRATASLVNVANDDLLWSDAFDASDQDQFALQDELVTAIARALNLSLSPATSTAVRARGTRSNEAHELVQRARLETDQFTASSLRSAISHAEAAIALDSTYADAWAALADAWGYMADDFVPAAMAGPQMRRAADRALALDPTLADAHAQVGLWSMTYGYDPAGASKQMEQALKLDSANVAAGGWYPFLLTTYLHLPDSARAVAQRAQRLNPLSFGVWNPFILSLDFAKLSPDSARAICVRAARIQDRLAAQCEALRSQAANDRSGAVAAWRRWSGPTPSGRDLAYLAVNLISAGDSSGGREVLRQALARANTEYVREDLLANAFMRLGDRESATQWLVKAAASNVGGIMFSLEDPLYAPIRSDPRIRAIVERLKVR
ncbi:MAG: protein kinase domain-containing protein [Gemmatimonadaceae bacterium]